MLAWVDVETTGLEPKEGCLLEVALVVTDDELRPLDEGASLLVAPIFGCMEKMDTFVENMHTKSGLLEEIKRVDETGIPVGRRRRRRRHEVEEALCKYLDGYTAQTDGKNHRPPMAGSSVHFDRAWLKEHMPKLEAKFSYRNVDVSTLKELWARWKPVGAPVRERGEIAHRAMPDVVASIDELTWYREQWLNPVREIKAD